MGVSWTAHPLRLFGFEQVPLHAFQQVDGDYAPPSTLAVATNLRPRLTSSPTPSSPPSSDRRRRPGQPAPRYRPTLRESSVCSPGGSAPCVPHYPSQLAAAQRGTALA